MKKIHLGFLLIGAMILFNAQNVQAQYQKGDKLLNIGIGVNSYYYSAIPIGAALEVGITDDISVGGAVSYASSKSFGTGWSSLYFGGRGSYHLNKVLNFSDEKFDIYGGAQLGLQSFKWKSDYSGISAYNGSDLRFGLFGGGRYYFQSKIAVYGEFGFGGYSNANIGVTFKF